MAAQHIAAKDASTPVDRAIDRLPAILADGNIPPDYFDSVMRAALPDAQFRSLAAQIMLGAGPFVRSSGIQRRSPYQAVVTLEFERQSIVTSISTDNSGQVTGLFFGPPIPRTDTVSAITTALAALPGQVSWGVYRISDRGDAVLTAGSRNSESLAIASTFKLAVLGALDADIRRGRSRWSDVVRLQSRSLPSGITQDWPRGSPLTLHSLATLMISMSDNTATDALITHIGRERIEDFARRHGGLSGPHAFPMLTTREAVQLKETGDNPARLRWLGAQTEDDRRAILDALDPTAPLSLGTFGDVPRDIAQTEWFASADSVAQLLAWFAREASTTSREILAISPGIAPQPQWGYIGYKGGSEPGVMSMNLLLGQTAQRPDTIISVHWNNPAARLDEQALAALVARLAALSPGALQPSSAP
ncbi:MAG: class A beta-lactamase-related serine hydrolase [Sphingopyxis sp.]|jgi:hypothetical protein|nr:class A beta-lactamase-related serine hydrolase [Sphingopyxis sp.]